MSSSLYLDFQLQTMVLRVGAFPLKLLTFTIMKYLTPRLYYILRQNMGGVQDLMNVSEKRISHILKTIVKLIRKKLMK
jgi:hypothetical protein